MGGTGGSSSQFGSKEVCNNLHGTSPLGEDLYKDGVPLRESKNTLNWLDQFWDCPVVPNKS